MPAERVAPQAFCARGLAQERPLRLHQRLLVHEVGVRSKHLEELERNRYLEAGGVPVAENSFERCKELLPRGHSAERLKKGCACLQRVTPGCCKALGEEAQTLFSRRSTPLRGERAIFARRERPPYGGAANSGPARPKVAKNSERRVGLEPKLQQRTPRSRHTAALPQRVEPVGERQSQRRLFYIPLSSRSRLLLTACA